MRFAVSTTLGAVALVALAGIVSSIYFVPSHWTAPKGLPPSADTLVGHKTMIARIDAGALVQTTERPLFSETRRPAPLEAPAEQAPEPDPLKDVVIYGLFQTGKDIGGAIVKIDGLVRRLRFGEQAGRWTLKGVEGRSAVFAGPAGERRDALMRFLPQPETAALDYQPGAAEGERDGVPPGSSAVATPGAPAIPEGTNPPLAAPGAPATRPSTAAGERRMTNSAERAARRAARAAARGQR